MNQDKSNRLKKRINTAFVTIWVLGATIANGYLLGQNAEQGIAIQATNHRVAEHAEEIKKQRTDLTKAEDQIDKLAKLNKDMAGILDDHHKAIQKVVDVLEPDHLIVGDFLTICMKVPDCRQKLNKLQKEREKEKAASAEKSR